MALFKCGGDSKKHWPLNVIGAAFVANASQNHTFTISRTDADFIVTYAFYKSSSVNVDYSVDGQNACAGIIDKVGDSVTMTGYFSIPDKTLATSGVMNVTWSKANTVDYTGNYGGGVVILLCKNV